MSNHNTFDRNAAWEDNLRHEPLPTMDGVLTAPPTSLYNLPPLTELPLFAQTIVEILTNFRRRLMALHVGEGFTATYPIGRVYPGGRVFLRLDNLHAQISEWRDFLVMVQSIWWESGTRGIVPDFQGKDAVQQLLACLQGLVRGVRRVGLAMQRAITMIHTMKREREGFFDIEGLEPGVREVQLKYLHILHVVLHGKSAGQPTGQKEIKGLLGTHGLLVGMQDMVLGMIEMVRWNLSCRGDSAAA